VTLEERCPEPLSCLHKTECNAALSEFVVLQADADAGWFPSCPFERESGYYALVCNLKGHYRMGMYQDFQVT